MAPSLLRLLMLLLLAASGLAQAADTLTISNAWVRATRPGQEVGAAYMDIKSASDTTLIKVESPAADFVEVHMMSMKNGVMEMRMLEEMPLPAGKTVHLEPGGFHLMLIDIKQPLKTGQSIAFTLHLKDAKGKRSLMKISVPVKSGAN